MTTTDTAPALLTVTEYAKLAKLNKSTVSRLVARGIIPNHAAPGAPPAIDAAEADAARLAQLDRSKIPGLLQAGGEMKTALGLGEPAGEPAGAEASAGAPAGLPRSTDGYQKARTARETWQALEAERSYRAAIGELIDRNDAADALGEILKTMQRGFAQRIQSLAERLVGMAEPDRIAAVIREEDRKIFENLSLSLQRLAEEPQAHDAAA